MLYKYEVTTLEGEKQTGNIEAPNIEIAINSLQRRNLIIISINPAEKLFSFWQKNLSFFRRVKTRDVVILSRQLATLFEAKVSVLDSFKLLADESENPFLAEKLSQIIEDIRGGIPMSQAMAKHPDVFSKFYVNMIMSGEESGKLEEVVQFLADYLERNYELSSKAKHALIYPFFVLFVFVSVIVLMMVFVIPRLADILTETGQELPLLTKIIISAAGFLRDAGPLLLVLLTVGIIFFWRFIHTANGRMAFSRFQISVPYVGALYKKLYLARISISLQTLLSSGVSLVRSLEITAEVVDNEFYSKILKESIETVKNGSPLSEALSKYKDIPPFIFRMAKIGEETGKLNFVLATIGRFYKREVENTVDNLVSLIEPVMIIVLGLAVGLLLISILVPIYNITSAI
jgi:type IV pilus assembly protein PilC